MSEVESWLRPKLADGSLSAPPETGPQTLTHAIQGEGVDGAPTSVTGAGTYPTPELVRAGLLRDAACCVYPQIATILRMDVSRVKRLCKLHWRCVELLPSYARLAAVIDAHCAALLDRHGVLMPATERSES
ncbi:MAG: hypothetical protein GY946_23345 [bacterium]|nr:hypothetical protein [bacterium]